MSDTARLRLPLMAAGQSQKHVTFNDAIALLDLLVGTIPVLDRSPTAPPGGTADGDVYILGGAGTGAWAGFAANDLALKIDGGWRRALPSKGMVATIADEAGILVFWNGTAWANSAGWGEVRKLTDEARTTTTALAADSALQLALLANTTYRIRLEVFFSAPAAPGIKYRLSGPASPTLVQVERRSRAPNATALVVAGDAAYTASTSIAGHATDHGHLAIEALIKAGVTAGTFSFDWAQDTSSASAATVRAGSMLSFAIV